MSPAPLSDSRPLPSNRRTVLPGGRVLAAALLAAITVGALLVYAPTTGSAYSTAAATDVRTGTVGLFPDTRPSRVGVDRVSDPVEVGVRFRSNRWGKVTGAQVYKNVYARGRTPVRASLWGPAGKRLATKKIPQRRGRGWVTVAFTNPVRIAPSRTYTVSVFAERGYYSFTEHVFGEWLRSGDLFMPARNGVYRYGRRSGFPTQTYASTNYWVDVLFRPGALASTTPTPTPAPTPAPVQSGFPNADNTGVPAGTSLTAYSGPSTITRAGTVIDAKRITGDLRVMAPDVTITRSSVQGTVSVDQAGSLRITDTDIDVGDVPGTGLEAYNFVAVRVHVTGGNRSMYCASSCTVRDSYVHGQFTDETGQYHESGIRMEQQTTLVHNTITCDAPLVPPDAGCSAGLTGYGDFAPVRDNLIQGNLFLPSTGSACAYGGSSAGKPYSGGARNVRFIDNVFSRGSNGKCGVWFAVIDFDPSAPGNEFTGNVWDGGGTVRPS